MVSTPSPAAITEPGSPKRTADPRRLPIARLGVSTGALPKVASLKPSGSSQVRCAPVSSPLRSVTEAMIAGQISVGECSSGRKKQRGWKRSDPVSCKDVMPRARRYVSASVRLIGCAIAKRRLAASGEPLGAANVLGRRDSRPGSGCGRLKKRRASSTTCLKSGRPQVSRMTSSRSPCSPVAASVHLPAAPLPVCCPLSRTNIERPGVLRTSPTSQ